MAAQRPELPGVAAHHSRAHHVEQEVVDNVEKEETHQTRHEHETRKENAEDLLHLAFAAQQNKLRPFNLAAFRTELLVHDCGRVSNGIWPASQLSHVSYSIMAGKQGASQLVQYIALRGDLHRTQKWPVGAMVAQGCHAATAVLHAHREHGNVIQYLNDLDNMHKVVLEVSR